MEDLDLQEMMQESTSDDIHVWFPAKKKTGKVKTVDMEPDDAYKAYQNG